MPQVSASRHGRCPRCFMQPHLCLCVEMPTVPTQTQFVVIRHFKEAFKTTNTARLAALAMPSLVIHDYGSRDVPFDPAVIPADAWLLFPSDTEHPAARLGIDPAPSCVVVLDGTWGQARRMSHRLTALDALPRFSPRPSAIPPRRVRKPPHPGGMATIEAIARAVALLEGEREAALLDALFDSMVAAVKKQRGHVHEETP